MSIDEPVTTARTVLEELKKTPVNVQSECRRLSPAYIFYNECERACDTGLPYKECVQQCAPDELQEGWVCRTGCRKLDTAMKNRFGDCPTTTEAIMPTEQNRHWINSPDIPSTPICTLDSDCAGDKMCCSGACMVPVFGNDIPQHVQLPQITEENTPRSFELSWNIGGENRATFDDPVLYVLQTTIPVARLSDPDVGWWYQYRIAAVNRYGSRGFGDSTTPPVRVTSQLPQAASSPRQLIDGAWRFQADGGVHVRIEWKTPASAVIPVTEYHIQCAPDDSSADKTTSLHIVPASQTHYLLRDLKTNMSYQIQVQAISSWGTKTFTSAPAKHFIITPGLPKREPFSQNRQSTEENSGHHDYGGDTQVACSCDSVKTRGDTTRPQISSNFQPLRFSQPNGGGLTIRFSNAPGVSDGQFLKTILTVNEFADATDPQLLRGEKLSPRLLTIQWKQQACIETGSQLSKTFMPLKPLDESGTGSSPQNENCRFVVLEPVQPATILGEDRLTRTGRVEVSSLQLNCHYSIFVAPHKRKSNENSHQQNSEQPPIPIGCLCTPACFDDQSSPWATHFSEDLSPPTDLKSQLLSESELVYNVSWRPPTVIRNPRSPRQETQPELNPSDIFYRVTWGPAMDRHLNPQILRLLADPYPRLDPTESQTKVLPIVMEILVKGEGDTCRLTKTSFLLTSLQPNSVYVFKIQSILLKPSNHHSDDIVDIHLEIIKSSGEDYLYLQTPTRAISLNALIRDAFINAAGSSRLHRDSMLLFTVIMCIVLYR
ncbi:unnamed protein product [Rodentolepis nana]|uniref:Fibronectin type-III domain-containing protein n=1 Tax=Rodentolepis nana TaxID=102285 RepID=A0A158QIL0_RODNA|nr:unnamed protein product [Rodentolepis nana]